jgi:hypothetical protein
MKTTQLPRRPRKPAWFDSLRAALDEAALDCAEEIQKDAHVSLWYPGHVLVSVGESLDPREIRISTLMQAAVQNFASDRANLNDSEYVATVLQLAESLESAAATLRKAMTAKARPNR